MCSRHLLLWASQLLHQDSQSSLCRLPGAHNGAAFQAQPRLVTKGSHLAEKAKRLVPLKVDWEVLSAEVISGQGRWEV